MLGILGGLAEYIGVLTLTYLPLLVKPSDMLLFAFADAYHKVMDIFEEAFPSKGEMNNDL